MKMISDSHTEHQHRASQLERQSPQPAPRRVQRRALAAARAQAAKAWFGKVPVQRIPTEEEKKRRRIRRASVGEAIEAGLELRGDANTLAAPGQLAGDGFRNTDGATVTVDDLIEQDFRDHLAGRGETSIDALIEEDFIKHLTEGE